MNFLNKKSWRASHAIWMRNATIYKRTWFKNLLPHFFEPFLYLLGMGVGLGFYIKSGVDGKEYLAFIGPGLVAAAAMNGATFESTYNVFVRMNMHKLYNAYLATPCSSWDVALGEMMWAVTRAFLYGFIFFLILGVYHLMGYSMLTSWRVLAVPFAIILSGMLFSCIGMFFTGMIKTIDYFAYYFTLFITPLFLFSGIFYPVERFPYGKQIAWFTPLYHCVHLMRGLMRGPFTVEHWISLVWIMVVSVLLFLALPRLYKSRLVD